MHWTYWIAEDYLQIYSYVAWDFEGIALPRVGGGGGRGTQQMFILGGSAPTPNPFPF